MGNLQTGDRAIAIVFPDYRVNASGYKLPWLGHAGVLLINNRTGLTKYYDYGRYDSADLGIVRNIKVPNAVIKDGQPTKSSLERVLRKLSLSPRVGKGTRIEGAEIRGVDFGQMNRFAIKQMKANKDPGRASYSALTKNCGTFMVDVIEAGGKDLPWILDPRPNSIIDEIRDDHPSLDFDPKTGLNWPLGGHTSNDIQDDGGLQAIVSQWLHGRFGDNDDSGHDFSSSGLDGDRVPDGLSQIARRFVVDRDADGIPDGLQYGKHSKSSLILDNLADRDGDGIPDGLQYGKYGNFRQINTLGTFGSGLGAYGGADGNPNTPI